MTKPLIPCPKRHPVSSGQHKFGKHKNCDPHYVECQYCGKTLAKVRTEQKLFREYLRMDIDNIAKVCGYFADCETNNGYGCNHPQNRAENKKECHRIGCPLAWYDSDKDQMVVHDDKLIAYFRKEWLN